MLTHLHIKNFKSWQDTDKIAFGRITAFFGTNSSGKSALLRFLMMLKQTVESNDQQQILHTGDRNSYVDVGTFFDFIYQRNPDNKLEFEFRIQPYGFPSKLPQPLRFAMTIGYHDGRVMADYVSYTMPISFDGGKSFENTKVSVDLVDGLASLKINASPVEQIPYEVLEKNRLRKFNEVLHNDTLLIKAVQDLMRGSSENTTDQERERLLDHAMSHSLVISGAIDQLFSMTHYLGPLREPPERIYIWGGQAPQDVGRRGELTIAALLSERGRAIQPRIAELLVQMGLAHSFKVAPIADGRREHEVLLQLAPGATPVALADVGVGLSQVLPVLVLCWYVPEGSIIIFEQPELHLHPRAQYALADVFIAATRERDVQIILESHSEHLLTRLQRRIAERNISDEEVCLYFTEIEAGTSQLERLAMDEYGNITNFPPDFFGNDLAELGAMLEAEIARSSTPSDDSP